VGVGRAERQLSRVDDEGATTPKTSPDRLGAGERVAEGDGGVAVEAGSGSDGTTAAETAPDQPADATVVNRSAVTSPGDQPAEATVVNQPAVTTAAEPADTTIINRPALTTAAEATVINQPALTTAPEQPADATVVNQPAVTSPGDQPADATVVNRSAVTSPLAEPDSDRSPAGEAAEAPTAAEPETFLTAEAMEFFAVPEAENTAAPTPVPTSEASAAKTFGVPEIFRTEEPTQFLPAPQPTEPAPEAELPQVVREPDDAETVVFAGVLDTSELDDQHPVPPETPGPDRPKNNPAVLTGVFTMILCSVLGLGLLGRIDNVKPVPGRAVAAPFTPTGTPASTEPGRPRAVQRLEDHPLLVTPKSLPEITCDLPKFSTSDQQLAAYYAAGVKCLDAAWGPVLKDANLPFEPPALDASPDLSDGPCGAAPASEDAVAYYCGRNRMIYMPTGRLRENGGGDRPATHLATLAHEYGHHVQAMSGMLRAADLKIVNAGEKSPAGLEMSRRIELQANCFAGMFLSAVAGKGSISTELANRAEEDFQYAMEEPPDKNAHGSPANQGTWALSGFNANTTDACNTYAAPAGQVS
jgi:predicted metalloprotease